MAEENKKQTYITNFRYFNESLGDSLQITQHFRLIYGFVDIPRKIILDSHHFKHHILVEAARSCLEDPPYLDPIRLVDFAGDYFIYKSRITTLKNLEIYRTRIVGLSAILGPRSSLENPRIQSFKMRYLLNNERQWHKR